MIRELGSDRLDLPHGFTSYAGAKAEQCICGRSKDNDLHKPQLPERASAQSGMQREIGT